MTEEMWEEGRGGEYERDHSPQVEAEEEEVEEGEEEEEAMERYLQRKQAQQQVSAGVWRAFYHMRGLWVLVGSMLDSCLFLLCVAATA